MEDSYRTVEPTNQAEFRPRGLWVILVRRKWIILQVTGAIFCVAMVVGLLQPRTYSASGWMLVTAPSKSGGSATTTTEFDAWEQLQKDLSMHTRLLARRELAETVLKQVRVDRRPGDLQANFSAAKVTGATANLLTITFRDPDPVVAQQVVNAWGAAYEQDNLQRRAGATIAAINYVQSQIESVEKQLAAIEADIAGLEQEHLSSGIGPNGGSAASRLVSVLQALADTQTQKAGMLAQIRRTQELLSQEPAKVHETEDGPSLAAQATRTQLAQLQLKLEELRVDYYEDSPEVKNLQEQIARLEERLASASDLTRTSLKTSNNPTHLKTREQLLELHSQLSALQAREQALRQQVDGQRRLALGVPPTNVRYNGLNRKMTALTAVHSSLLSRLYDLQLQRAMATPAVQMVKGAELPTTPVEPPMQAILGAALLLGLLLGVISAVVADQIDDTFADVSEVDEAVGERVIGALPQVRSTERVGLRIVERPRGPYANAVRMLASAVRVEAERNGYGSLLVTSAMPGDGKTGTAVNLAVSLAKAGQPVLLVDCDLHGPTLHKELGVQNHSGLSNLLVREASIAEVLQRSDIENLTVITSGPQPPSPVDLLASDTGAQVIAELNRQDALVIWDTPPAACLADAIVLGAQVDAVLLIVSNHTKRRLLRETVRNLYRASIGVLGLVTNRLDQASVGSGYYYYYYPYGSSTHQDDEAMQQ